MTYEYTVDTEEQRRIHALEKAIESDVGHANTETILKRARDFETYLRGHDIGRPEVNITVNERKARW